jgi:hypothetical protein
MKRMKTVGLCLIAVGAVSAIGAGGASAAPPELGRCLKASSVMEGKKTSYTGAYAEKGCTRLNASHKGKYEWSPGPGAKSKFFGTGLEPEPTLETTGGAKVVCSSLALKGGEYTGPKTAKVAKLLFSGCEGAPGRPCQTVPVKEGEIESSGELQMELGVIKAGTRPVVGWDIKKEGVVFAFQCGKLPELHDVQTVEGSVIAPLKTGSELDVNRMSIKALLKYKAKAGKQLPEAFEGGGKDTLTTTTTIGTSKAVEQTGLTNNLELESGLGELGIENPENQEPLEVKAF